MLVMAVQVIYMSDESDYSTNGVDSREVLELVGKMIDVLLRYFIHCNVLYLTSLLCCISLVPAHCICQIIRQLKWVRLRSGALRESETK